MTEGDARVWIERIRGLDLAGLPRATGPSAGRREDLGADLPSERGRRAEGDGRRRLRIMNVCGGHERTIAMAGMRAVLPTEVELIPGPGCPVCVCPEEDLHFAIQLALHRDAILLTFGDMLRVPTNAPRREVRSLEEARAAGARVVPIASPSEVVAVAERESGRRVVFFAAGFETTMAPVAARIAEGLPPNVELLVSGRRTWPAVASLLEADAHLGADAVAVQLGADPVAAHLGAAAAADGATMPRRDGVRSPKPFDALIAPGHVSAVMGPEEWRFVPEAHGIPTAVAGFRPEQLLAGLHAVLSQIVEGRAELENCYGSAVAQDGNPTARALLESVFAIVDAPWRGIGTIPASGYALRGSHADRDVRRLHPDLAAESAARKGTMPPGCACADVVLGRIYPTECPLFGATCVPRNPVGPCMVSDEGACRIWWAGGIRTPEDLRALHG